MIAITPNERVGDPQPSLLSGPICIEHHSARLKIESKSDHWMNLVDSCLWAQIEEIWDDLKESTSVPIHDQIYDQTYVRIREGMREQNQ